MTWRFATLRFAWPSILLSLFLMAQCAFLALSLYSKQSKAAAALSETILSRRAAVELEEAIEQLAKAHLEEPAMIDMVHRRVPRLMESVDILANNPLERELADHIHAEYARYLEAFAALPMTPSARVTVQRELVKRLDPTILNLCNDLRDFNAAQIEILDIAQRQTLSMLAWGLAGVGVVGAAGGLFIGYAVARHFQQTIHRLQVRVQAVAGHLGKEVATVEVSGAGIQQLHDQLQRVVQQVEVVVQKLQQREREVLRAEQLAAVGQLAAGVAHEIRNPLTSVKMLAETLQEDLESRGQNADDCRVIRDEIRRMERSLNLFLDFARPPRLEKAPADLGRLVEHTLSLVQGRAQRQRVQLEFARPQKPVVVDADGGQLQQVLVNLALNSLDAMPAGGTLHVAMKPAERGEVELEVSDTGPGIAPDMLPRLFEPFVSNKETGMGLGLVTSQRIVEDHGGRLTAGNRPAGGASFIIRLPARAA